MIGENLSTFHELQVVDFKTSGDLGDPASTAPRVRCEYDSSENLSDYLGVLVNEPKAAEIKALVLGLWAVDGETFEVSPREAIEFLVANKSKLPNLEAVFVGDIISEENEISWIGNDDMSAIWGAFPKLQEFGVRGTANLRLGKINHANLKKLVVQSGGLPGPVAGEALDANAPLEHFELWFGVEDYGLTTFITQFDDLFAGRLFPNLRTLALRNCDYADEIAAALAKSEIIKRIEHLDLSLGTFRDPGAEALAASGRIGHLKSLNVDHNFMSDGAEKRLAAATPNLIVGERGEADEYDGETHYYVSVSE